MTEMPFRYRLKWWMWIFPRRRRQVKFLNELVRIWWEKDGEKELRDAMVDNYLFGHGYSAIPNEIFEKSANVFGTGLNVIDTNDKDDGK